MSAYVHAQRDLRYQPRRWLVTGAAGFIGSHLVQRLLEWDQIVTGLDNFSTGHRRNLEEVQSLVATGQWARFDFIEGDLGDLSACRRACDRVELVLHQAALGSVPRSMADPVTTHQANVTGFLHLLLAAREAGVQRVVFASSSSVYGDDPALPKREDQLGTPLSPYAATKLIDEIYARAFAAAYGLHSIALRYFNVFGPRQDPAGAYAAVIPRWIGSLVRNEAVQVNGDGETSRDFCYIDNVVQANVLAATTGNPDALDQAYNIAVGERISLNSLLSLIWKQVSAGKPPNTLPNTEYRDFRPGDVRHSLADVSKARSLLGYEPTHRLAEGLAESMSWYWRNLQ